MSTTDSTEPRITAEALTAAVGAIFPDYCDKYSAYSQAFKVFFETFLSGFKEDPRGSFDLVKNKIASFTYSGDPSACYKARSDLMIIVGVVFGSVLYGRKPPSSFKEDLQEFEKSLVEVLSFISPTGNMSILIPINSILGEGRGKELRQFSGGSGSWIVRQQIFYRVTGLKKSPRVRSRRTVSSDLSSDVVSSSSVGSALSTTPFSAAHSSSPIPTIFSFPALAAAAAAHVGGSVVDPAEDYAGVHACDETDDSDGSSASSSCGDADQQQQQQQQKQQQLTQSQSQSQDIISPIYGSVELAAQQAQAQPQGQGYTQGQSQGQGQLFTEGTGLGSQKVTKKPWKSSPPSSSSSSSSSSSTSSKSRSVLHPSSDKPQRRNTSRALDRRTMFVLATSAQFTRKLLRACLPKDLHETVLPEDVDRLALVFAQNISQLVSRIEAGSDDDDVHDDDHDGDGGNDISDEDDSGDVRKQSFPLKAPSASASGLPVMSSKMLFKDLYALSPPPPPIPPIPLLAAPYSGIALSGPAPYPVAPLPSNIPAAATAQALSALSCLSDVCSSMPEHRVDGEWRGHKRGHVVECLEIMRDSPCKKSCIEAAF